MNKKELDKIVAEHKLWIDEQGGKRADLRYANLSGTDFSDTDLRYIDFSGADLSDANLRGANLDFASFPIWCGGKNWKVDKDFFAMMCAFLCSWEVEDQECIEAQSFIIDLARKCRRAEEILDGKA